MMQEIQKITSYEEHVKWARTLNRQEVAIPFSSMVTCTTDDLSWWMRRESLRITNGIYKVTPTLKYLNKISCFYAHISTEDSKLIAYTPSQVAGLADKQIKSTIGAFISKYFPVFSENYVRRLVEEHAFYANPTVTWYSGDELTDVYMHRFGELGACMSSTKFDTRRQHPTVAYHTPHIKLACFEIGGKIIARTLVYENGKDKRQFRCYGNKGLETHLKNLGYKVSDWRGIHFKKVNIRHCEDSYIFPYLDANGTRGYEHDFVVLENSIYAITEQQKRVIPSKYITRWLSASGYATFTEQLDKSIYETKCLISGLPINLFQVSDKEIANYYDVDNDKHGYAYVNQLNAEKYELFTTTLNNTCYAVKSYNKKYNGDIQIKDEKDDRVFYKLDVDRYGEDGYSHDVVCINEKFYLKKDVVDVYTSATQHFSVLNDKAELKKYIKTHAGIYITKDAPYLVTNTGRKVVAGLHSFYTLYDGSLSLRKPKYEYGGTYLYQPIYSNHELDLADQYTLIGKRIVEYMETDDRGAVKESRPWYVAPRTYISFWGTYTKAASNKYLAYFINTKIAEMTAIDFNEPKYEYAS